LELRRRPDFRLPSARNPASDSGPAILAPTHGPGIPADEGPAGTREYLRTARASNLWVRPPARMDHRSPAQTDIRRFPERSGCQWAVWNPGDRFRTRAVARAGRGCWERLLPRHSAWPAPPPFCAGIRDTRLGSASPAETVRQPTNSGVRTGAFPPANPSTAHAPDCGRTHPFSADILKRYIMVIICPTLLIVK
jgi:hypothetical protein